ncbi:ferrochelatase [Pirellula sp. SH-Sr6A]|uniref:ferrochelatase n=1 Tax=Pirellula sp. SH-Sr6A TaxID=1632865 RepID=UPI0021112065|nr:ferrochelatase [Pirellula sp. SH-Sr6A]
MDAVPIDSILLVSFGGPEGMDDVIPFLENVLRGKNVPKERMLEVADHYRHFGGISPINQQCRDLLKAIRGECQARGIDLPIYWGNRNWHPLLPDTLREMANEGKKRAIAFFTSMFSCYSGCRQYRENIADAQTAVGENAPLVEKVRMGFNHPKFIAAQADCVRAGLEQIPAPELATTKLLYCAHSIPMGMSQYSRYVEQLREAARLVSEAVGHGNWELVFQSRSGPPQQPWLEPDVCDRIEQLANEEGLQSVVLVPLGFISDHMEVLYDLDEEAAQLCKEKGIGFVRAHSVGIHPEFVSMIVDLIEERLATGTARPFVGTYGPSHDLCPANCCLYPQTARPMPSPSQVVEKR